MTNPLKDLETAGQSVWLDYLHRDILQNGQLARFIEDDGVKGLTSNPTIFEKAIGESETYDKAIGDLSAKGETDAVRIYERLAVSDIQGAADRFRPVFDALGGGDGFARLEVSPRLANDTEGSVEEAWRLWKAVDRPNVMIKIPGTRAGVPAIRKLIGEGINVNVTLLFGIEAYLAVAEAHIAGLEDLVSAGGDPSRTHGVASVFVSRIDTAIDTEIDRRVAAKDKEAGALSALRGRVGVANSKIAYQHYLELVGGDRWKALAGAGARPQRLLWASTGTKDPAYSDVLYPEALIGPDTVDTLPPKTLDAFRDHGRVAPTLTADVTEARFVLAETQRLGLDLAGVTDRLVEEGVASFSKSFDALLKAVADKQRRLAGAAVQAG